MLNFRSVSRDFERRRMFVLLIVIVAGSALNLAMAAMFWRHIRQSENQRLEAGQSKNASSIPHNKTPAAGKPTPEVAVMMSVRGCDPGLAETVKRLLDQDYARYSVNVVVDHVQDPAWELLTQLKIEHDSANRLRLATLETPLSTCGLKCSSLIQAFQSLPQSTDIVAIVDADVRVHPGWIADLTAPFEDKGIAVVSGSQWFEPPASSNSGSIIRSIWNAGALVPTVLLQHPWAGSMAMRYAQVAESSLIERWSQSFVDDGPIAEFAKEVGGKIFVSPRLLMVNREPCSRQFSIRWMSRMLTWSRVYESTFFLTFLHACVSVFFAVAIDVILIVAILSMSRWMMVVALAAFLIAAGNSLAGYVLIRRGVSSSLRQRGQPPLKRLNVSQLWQLLLMLGPVQLLYLYSCLVATFRRTVQWRGIEYAIEGKRCRMIQYQPWQRSTEVDASESI